MAEMLVACKLLGVDGLAGSEDIALLELLLIELTELDSALDSWLLALLALDELIATGGG